MRNRGFTLIELIIVMSIFVTLAGFVSIGLVNSQQASSLASTEGLLVADLRQQQLKAMIGDTEGRLDPDSYGIHFDSDKYVLFHGSTYSSEETSNSVINLPDTINFEEVTASEIIFQKVTGEIATSPFIIKLQNNTNSKLKRIHLNKYGVVTEVESL